MTTLDDDLELSPIGGSPRPVREWLTTFHLASVVVDPYTNESSWILGTAERILEEFRGSQARVNFVVTADERDALRFLGPLTERFLVFCDPERTFVRAVGLSELPAFVVVRVDREVAASAEGWSPREWEAVAETLAAVANWNVPDIPAPSDPVPFAGTRAG